MISKETINNIYYVKDIQDIPIRTIVRVVSALIKLENQIEYDNARINK